MSRRHREEAALRIPPAATRASPLHIATHSPDPIAAHVLALQRIVGNQATASLIRSPPFSLQRAPVTEDQALATLADSERNLQRQMGAAQDFIEGHGGKPGKPPGRPSVDRPPPGARRLPSLDWLDKELRKIGLSGDPVGSRQAAVIRKSLREAHLRVTQAQQGLTAARRGAGARTTAPKTQQFKGKEEPKFKSSKSAPGPSSKTPPTSGPGPDPRPKLPAAEGVSAAKEAGRFRTLAGKFTRAFKSFFSSKVLVPLRLISELLNAIDLIQMTESAVRGRGFMFGQQLKEASALARQIDDLIKSYRDSRFHEDLDDLVSTAKRNDERYSEYAHTPAEYWGTEELSEFCTAASEIVRKHVTTCSQLSEHLDRVLQDVGARIAFCKRLREDPVTWAALSLPHVSSAAHVVAAQLDLERILNVLVFPSSILSDHLAMAEKDLQVMDDNILQRGWLL